jgi:RNA polymerase sigma-70 factor (ECF subfamily)
VSAATHDAVDHAARDSYARLLAYLAARSRDLATAEDALADAFRAALETWPRDGVPNKPEAWLLTAARRKLVDAARRARVRAEAMPTLLALADEATHIAAADGVFPDERLKLMFVCAHPAIDPSARTPLMLQTVLGLDAARIGAAFVVQPATMGQRLSRAKTKIRDARIRFELPDASQLRPRLDAVLEAIYAAYGSSWDDIAGADARRRGLAAEALELGRLVVRLVPDQPEAQGLLALMLHCEARRDARRTSSGEYVPLAQQDPALWCASMIHEAEETLTFAAHFNRAGRFQLEAAIQSAHAQRARTGRTNWEAIALLYEGLVRIAPTVGALVGRAAAVANARGSDVGWSVLQHVPAESAARYQPYWAVAARLLAALGRTEESREAYARAIALCDDSAVRAFLSRAAKSLAMNSVIAASRRR